jgi:hypothetical protein
MLSVILIAGLLAAVTVVVHTAGFAVILKAWMRSRKPPPTGLWPIIWLLVRVTWCVILIHLVEIGIWGLFYLWEGCLPDAEAAFYFSGVTYATVGYGDLVLPEPWRILGPVEGLTGILMCGLSTGLFVAVVSAICASRKKPNSG